MTDPTPTERMKWIKALGQVVFVFLLAGAYLRNKERALEESFGYIDVLSAAADMPGGQALRSAQLTTRRIPLRFVEPGAILVKYPGQGMERVSGKVSAADLSAGSQITQSALRLPPPDPNDPIGVANAVSPGKRAVPLRINSFDIAELILPGDHVDVIGVFEARQGETQTRAASSVLQDARVVSIGRVVVKPGADVVEKPKESEGLQVWLELDLDQAQRLMFAQSQQNSEIVVTARPHGDHRLYKLPVTTVEQIAK